VTKAIHTIIEMDHDGESRWKNVGMRLHSIECAGGEVGKGVNEERTRKRTKEERKKFS
jgi:hypothetical protein